ncbi:MAG: GTPase Era [Synechococcus sp. SB0668_bin_15]|nr:GTPase Era [Synechococcus sp. SB0668_bin_15]MYC49191.1 GTPase Era [Synechococcus sp. SB0662_bin_14]
MHISHGAHGRRFGTLPQDATRWVPRSPLPGRRGQAWTWEIHALLLSQSQAPAPTVKGDHGVAPPPPGYRSGFVALIGRPNVGKSTLLNQLVGHKVAITSPVAQTTRNRLRGILTRATAQLVLLDTPGIHKPHHLLGEHLVKVARSTLGEVDLVLLLMDGSTPPGRGDAYIVQLLRHCAAPLAVGLNKQDLVTPKRAAELQRSYRSLVGGCPFFGFSALSGVGCEQLVEGLSQRLPEGPHLYPPHAVSDQPERLLLAEQIREQVLHLTREEVPHSVAVRIDDIREERHCTRVTAVVLVERSSQKGILIGKGGGMLKAIGTAARLQMQTLIAGPVHLELFVKVSPHWRRHPGRLAELGYGNG